MQIELLIVENKHGFELQKLTTSIEKSFRAAIEGVTELQLNHVFAPHKMTIGQLAIHCTAWASYFLAPEDNKPWKVEKWTCKPISYPITTKELNTTIDEGFQSIRDVINETSDAELEIQKNGSKGHGYIIYRLLIHAMVHANQIAYLRQLLDENWDYASHFGNAASAIIATDYITTRDLTVQGF